MRLVAVGRMRAGAEADLCARYLARLRPKLDVIEVAEGAGQPAEMKRREAASLLDAVGGAFLVALDQDGAGLSSEAFAALLGRWTAEGRKPCFVIGGAEGLDRSVLARADYCLSLGTLTWPHMLARILLAEQLFRAQCILTGHPYHRAGRP